MRLTHTGAALQSPCRLLAVALVGFCYLSAEAYSGDESPRIVSANVSQKGDKAVFSCKADPGYPDDFTLIFWLVNRTFIELAYPMRRIHETPERALEENGHSLVQRDLIFRKVQKEDYRANYTCVVTSPAGIDTVTLRLRPVKGREVKQARRRRRTVVKKPKTGRRRQTAF